MSLIIDDQQNRTSSFSRQCAICGSKAIGVNFGAPTCAPCKAFFRRNARRKEVFDSPCQHGKIDLFTINNNDETTHCFQIRRCSSCRLRRCFDMGMKEELVRTDEENIRHKELVNINKRRRELFKQKQHEKLLSIPQTVAPKNELLRESDWRHLSNIVSAYDTHCLRTYIHRRSMMFRHETTPSYSSERLSIQHYTALPLSLMTSLFSFLQSLPAFHSLSRTNRTYLNKTNLRPLLLTNMFELNQTCYSEPWQISLDKSTWQFICGPELYEQFTRTETLAERLLIMDPTITRLWLVILFFSSSLSCSYDKNLSFKIPRKKTSVMKIQNAYVTLLWNYLLHRYGNDCTIQIFSNLIRVYLKMKSVGFGIGMQMRTRTELTITHQTVNQLLTLDIHHN